MSQNPPNFSQPPSEFVKPAMANKPLPSQTSVLAIFSIIFGFLSLLFSCLAGIIGVTLGVISLIRINKSNGAMSGRGLAITGIIMSIVMSMFSGLLLGMLLPAIQQVRHAARRTTAITNVRQIVLAEHNYQSTHNKFSGTGLADDEPGAGLSWRVHILPYLEQQLLYDQFKLDEPWDSEHNKQLIPLMPTIYAASLGSKSYGLLGAGETTILRPVGNGAFPAFDDPKRKQPFGFDDISDAISNTILVIEADASEAVTWTDPAGDYQFDPVDPTRGYGESWLSGVFVGMVDGSVQAIQTGGTRVPLNFPEQMQGMFTVAGDD